MTDDDKLIDEEGNVDEEELDRRIREMGLDESPSELAKAENEKIDDEFESRLAALEERAKTHRKTRENQQREVQRQQEKDRDSARGLGVGLSVAYTIIGMPILGLAVGWFLDRGSDSNTYKSIGAIAGMALGITAALLILSKSNRSS